MNWLKWILAYFFDCVHPRTTWPHRDRAGLAYVCCLDCGRELPYSLELMKIATRNERQPERARQSFNWNGVTHRRRHVRCAVLQFTSRNSPKIQHHRLSGS